VSGPKRRLSALDRSIGGRVACVTGAASGMGRATAQLFADEGARVAVVDRVGDGVAKVVDEIGAAGGEAAGFVADLAHADEIERLVRSVVDRFGGLDILVNNAGVSFPAAIDSAEWPSAWERTIAVNLAAPARLVRAFLPYLVAKQQGRIVNIASTEGLGATYGMTPYTATKHGVIGLTKSLAVELGARGVTVNCVCPGPIRTGMTAEIPEEAKTRFARRKVPLQRYAEPEEVAQMTLSLVLPASSFVNGAVVVVDGGMVAKNDLGTPRAG
jgi:3-oxoacyl-[acyl-carrier protein] reductase